MLDRFPYGKAPLALLVIAVLSSLAFAVRRQRVRPADLVVATFSAQHYAAYAAAVPEFERRHGVRVDLQRYDSQSLESRLQAAIVANTDVPDLAEINEGSLGFFTRGPVEDFGFADLTDRIRAEGLDHRVVESRFVPWSARGRVYALPHDVHPVMLAYRRDLVEELGIDVNQLETWADFVAMGQKFTADLDGDGAIDRYALELQRNGNWGIWTLLRQQGVDLFDANGEVAFNGPVGVETVMWYLRQTRGPQRIAYDTGLNSGQPFFRALMDGLLLFVLCPDWRSYQIQTDAASLKGKMALMPLPAWQKGGRRTSTWGMTGLTLSKTSKNPELAWELAKHLYFNTADLGARFLVSNIIPPLKDAWDLPEFQLPNEYFSGQKLGAEYARLAPHTPPVHASPVYKSAQSKLDQAITRSGVYFEQQGEQGLREKVQEELDRAAKYLKVWSDRHGRLAAGELAAAQPGEAVE